MAELIGAVRRVNIALYFEDDIKTFPAICESGGENGFTLKVAREVAAIINGAVKVEAFFFTKNVKTIFDIAVSDMTNADDDEISFTYLNKTRTCAADSYHSIDYKGIFTIAPIVENRETEYISIADRINSANRDNLTRKIKETIASGSDNADVLKILAEMDLKLSRVLALLEKEPEIPGGIDVRGVSISGGGFLFFYPNGLKSNRIFSTSLLTSNGERVRFASICSVEEVYKNIYQASFINCDEHIRDEITRFVFAKEREILKKARL